MCSSSGTGGVPTEGLLDGFVGYLRTERGVTALTVEAYVSDVRKFLAHRGESDVSGLTAADVSNAVLGQVADRSPASVRRYGCALRSFLRYCYLVGVVDHDLSAAALPVSGRRRSLLPQGITPTEARLLLRACDRRRASGRRDYAAIVSMLRLGPSSRHWSGCSPRSACSSMRYRKSSGGHHSERPSRCCSSARPSPRTERCWTLPSAGCSSSATRPRWWPSRSSSRPAGTSSNDTHTSPCAGHRRPHTSPRVGWPRRDWRPRNRQRTPYRTTVQVPPRHRVDRP
jgi:hypothetical protein